jgi:hypothetical protein
MTVRFENGPVERRSRLIDEVSAFRALAFSTLLSSQGADAHLRRTFVRVWGNLCNLPDRILSVNQVRKNFFVTGGSCLARQDYLSLRLLRTAQGILARGTSWRLPVDWPLSRPHPAGQEEL